MRHSVLFATAFATLISTQTFAADLPGKVVMTTEIGTQALLPQPGGELLPRIC